MTDSAAEEHLSPGDKRWLQGEFAATRLLVANLDGSTKAQITAFQDATDARFGEHHERISALERRASLPKPSGQRNRLAAALVTACAAIAGAVTAVASVFQTPTKP